LFFVNRRTLEKSVFCYSYNFQVDHATTGVPMSS
jgi:hypothetical protein